MSVHTMPLQAVVGLSQGRVRVDGSLSEVGMRDIASSFSFAILSEYELLHGMAGMLARAVRVLDLSTST